MKYRQLTLISLFLALVSASGCATVLTVANPPLTETRNGESVLSDPVGFNYVLIEEKDDFLLEKQPLCGQKVQLMDVKRKQLHGVIPAVVEIPLFGLGLLDLVVAGIYTRATMDVQPNGLIDGPEVSVCGDFEPVSDQAVFVQYPVSITSKTLSTDETGRIPFKKLIPDNPIDDYFTVFVRDETGLIYVKTYEKSAF